FAASWFYFFAVVFPATVVGRVRGRRVVLNYRGGDARPFFARYRWAVRRVLALANEITVPSRFLADLIRDSFDIAAVIVPNLIDLSAFRYRQRSAVRPNFLVTRQLEKIYDVETVLRAFRKIQRDWPEASLWIAGSGREEQRLRGLQAEWQLESVRFFGHVAHRELPRLYDECDVLLNASRVDNFPGALLEASAAGLVVVSTNAGGIPFMYRNRETALLVDPGDWEALAAAAATVLQQPEMAMELTKNAAALARGCEWQEVRKS